MINLDYKSDSVTAGRFARYENLLDMYEHVKFINKHRLDVNFKYYQLTDKNGNLLTGTSSGDLQAELRRLILEKLNS